MAAAGEGEEGLAALLQHASLASDLDLAFQLQLAETLHATPASHDAAYALALHAADLARAARDRRHALAAAAAATLAEEEEEEEGSLPLFFRVLFKGMASKEVVGPRDRDPAVAVLAAAVCGPRGEVLRSVQRPVEEGTLPGGREVLEATALVEGLHAALAMGARSVEVVTDYRALHHHMHGIWRITQKKVADVINQVMSVQSKFEQFEMLLVPRSEVGYVMKLARDSIDAQIAKALAADASKEKRETCTICLEDTDISKFHAIEGCAHRFCFSCMKEHVKVKLLNGMLPACPHDGCTTKLTVEGSKVFLSPQLLDIMVERIKEGQIPPTQKIYCPYPKCSALMSLGELINPMQESSSKHTIADAATLRKCLKCRGSFCIRCKVPWHYRMTCYDYRRRHPHARPDDARLQNLAQQQLWRQCVRCKHMIELAEGCYHMTCVCGYEFCYTCGKEWKEKKATCSCPLWDESNIIQDDYYSYEDEDDYYDEDDEDEDEDGVYLEERGILYNRAYWHYNDAGARRPDNYYRY
ncbi:hypothetical protein ACP4OV_013181 [Aristida adscensionis]